MNQRDNLPTPVRRRMEIIADEFGCPSWIPGTHEEFSFCCDSSKRPCYCEQAARKIMLLEREEAASGHGHFAHTPPTKGTSLP